MFQKGVVQSQLYDPPELIKDFGDQSRILSIDFLERDIYVLIENDNKVAVVSIDQVGTVEDFGSAPKGSRELHIDWLHKTLVFLIEEEGGTGFHFEECQPGGYFFQISFGQALLVLFCL